MAVSAQLLRRRAASKLAKAREIIGDVEDERDDVEGEEDRDEDLSPEAQAAHDELVEDAEKLVEEAEEVEEKSRKRAALLARLNQMLPHQDGKNTRGGRHEYKTLRALQGDLAVREGKGRFTGLEAETHQELARSKKYSGVAIPWDAPYARSLTGRNGARYRDLTTTTGAGSVGVLTLPTLIDALRAKLVTVELGATILSDLDGAFAIPRLSSSATTAWYPEGVAPTPSNPEVDQVPFSPKTVGSTVIVSRRFVLQSSVDAEAMVQDDLLKIVARAVEEAALIGTGLANQPKGITGYGSPVGNIATPTNGGPLTWAIVNAMVGAVEMADAESDTRGFLFNPATIAHMATVPKAASYPSFLFDADLPGREVAGQRTLSTSLLPNTLTKGSGTNLSVGIFGNWSDLIMALFSAMDVIIDPYSGGHGNLKISVLQDADVNLRQPKAFAVVNGINTAPA